MEIIYSQEAKKDLEYWKKSGNKAIQKRISLLISAIIENPYLGIGKPELLKYDLSGKWSRRINNEHRITYRVTNNNEIEILTIFTLKGHYE